MISVCMATYNGGKYIQEQVESILEQLGVDDELVVSDDGSKDDTLKILSCFHDDRIKVYLNTGEHGFVKNFENALIHSQGDVIFLSDQDDIWHPDKVKTVLPLFDNYDLIVHDADLIDGDGKPLCKTYFSLTHGKRGFLANLWKTRWLGCCMAFKRDVLNVCLPFPKRIVAHDYWIGMMGMVKFNYCFFNNALISYRRHNNNVSTSSEKSSNSMFYMLLTKRVNLIIAIACRMFYIIGKK